MKKIFFIFLPISLMVLTSCSSIWNSTEIVTLNADIVEKSFPEDLLWVENYGKNIFITTNESQNVSSLNHWIRFNHPLLPISFAYPKNARIQIKELDLNIQDTSIDIIVSPLRAEKITIIFQTDLENPSHIGNNGHYSIDVGGITGTYYKARNINGGKNNLEKFIAKIPNSRYGIHMTGNGEIFHTLINTLKVR